MNFLLVIAQILLPALLVLATVYLMNNNFRQMVRNRQEKMMAEEARKVTLPVRLQAYERLALLMERIAPVALVLRVSRPGIDLYQLQLELIQTIHEEFEHNLSQQIYVSAECWSLVRSAVEYTIQRINLTVAALESTADVATFSAHFLQHDLDVAVSPSQQALATLRNEVSRLF